MKQRSISYIAMRISIDLLSITTAWFLAWFIRFELLPGGETDTFFHFLRVLPILFLVNLITFTKNNLYHINRYYSWYRETTAVARAITEAFALFFVILYFLSILRMSRLTFALYGILSLLICVCTRLLVRRFIMTLRKNGKNLRNLLVVGKNRRVCDYVKTLSFFPQAGIKITGWIDSGGTASEYGIKEYSMDILDSDHIKSWDLVVTGYPLDEQERIRDIIYKLNKQHMKMVTIPDLQYDFLGYKIHEFEGIPLIEINEHRMSMYQAALKRLMDITGSLFGIILLSPVFLITALLVKLSSKGPVLYGQERVSLDGRLFTMWKFRSMRVDAEVKNGAQWATKDDNRKTAIGSFLRKTSLDEIPQFFNVLFGDMSLVGPRPERPVFVDEFQKNIPSYMLRHRMKTGITGWAQVNGWRGNTSIEKRIEFDLYYIQHWSLSFDVLIVLLTFVKGFVNPNAY